MNDGSFANFIEGAGRARLADEPLPEFAESERPQGVDQGYTVQVRLAEWFKNHGQGNVAGYKIGATTRNMQEFIGVDAPAYGHLMSENILSSGAQLSGKHLCKTGVECELAIILSQDIPVREELWARDEFADFIEAVAPAIEIVENRYGDFRSVGIGTLVADDFFHKACVLGTPLSDWQNLNFPSINARVSVNGTNVETGEGAEILGHPFEAIVWLANIFATQGRVLHAGDVVFTGSMTPVYWINEYPRQVEVELEGVGTCAVEMV